ncbi:TonB-dependent receptor plug domain-containing protein [Yunchengibacter salinarum]|uniref:TonB-dependent receptor plug domain-containing protein n=1 Tax=Yunchengibacter salinarum TaxID=3133399 RepID=UPI0035B6879C
MPRLIHLKHATALTAGILASAHAGLMGSAATAQDSELDTASDMVMETVVVTGTRRTDRTLLESPVPVDVLSNSDLTNQGFTETNQVLNRLVPSFNFPQPSITDGTDHVRPATLRGLSPDHTLVLINGKRRHQSALLNVNGSVGRGSSAVDMNMIPTTAIQRIEVLRDGAAAQYGSDAIAGVINVRLLERREGGTITATYGQHATTLDGVSDINGVVTDADGLPVLDDRGNIQLDTTGKDRTANDGETLTIAGNIGFGLGDEGFISFAAEYRDRNPTNRAGFDPRVQFGLNDDGSFVNPGGEVGFDRLNHRFGNSAVEDLSVFMNAAAPITDTLEFYAFGSLGVRDGESAGFFRRASDSRNVPEINPQGFLPLITSEVNDYSLAAGVRGDVGGWNSDLSLVWGQDEFRFGVENSLNTSLGPTSPTEFDAGGTEFRQIVANLDLQRTFDMAGLATPLSVAFGFELRDEQYEVKAGEPASFVQGDFPGAPGSQVFPGFQPSNEVTGNRDSVAAYVELDADIVDGWNVSVAGRFEDYSDFGSTLNGKLASRYAVTDWAALRGAIATGFRAPGLQQQFFTATSTNFIDGIPNEVGTFAVGSDVAQTLGASELDNEESLSLSAGLVLTPVEGLSVTIDYYNIDLDDRVVLTENLPSSVVVPILQANGIEGVQRARFFINGIDTTTEGLDIVANYQTELGEAGNLTLTAGFNANDTTIDRVIAAPGPLAIAGITGEDLFSRREQLRFEEGQPETKLNLRANWQWEALGITLATTRYGKALDPGSTAVTDELLSAKWITDLDVRYDVSENVTLSVGANNVFDVFPDTSPTGARPDGGNFSTFNEIFPFSNFSPFGFNGRYLYARVRVDW